MRHHGLNIVAIGGGTGLSTLLRGLKAYVDADGPWSIARLGAIVTVTDEGGSSGALRKEFGMLPPGDIRNCIVALAEEEHLLSRLFSYRFENTESSLGGHSLGNLLLAALTDITGSFDEAILTASEVLNIAGEIYPSTLADVRLRATLAEVPHFSAKSRSAARTSAKRVRTFRGTLASRISASIPPTRSRPAGRSRRCTKLISSSSDRARSTPRYCQIF